MDWNLKKLPSCRVKLPKNDNVLVSLSEFASMVFEALLKENLIARVKSSVKHRDEKDQSFFADVCSS